MIYKAKRILISLVLSIIISGCSDETTKPFPKDSNITIDVGYMNETQFKQRYSGLIDSEYPNMRTNVISTMDLLKSKVQPGQWMQENSVDLIYIPSNLMKEFVNNGLLTDIETFVKKDQFDLNQFVPGSIELTRAYGDGTLYGLPPSFYGKAVVFNRNLFDEYSIEYPKDQMSWEDILLLAGRFNSGNSTKTKFKGLATNYLSPVDFVLSIGKAEGLRVYNKNKKQLMFNQKPWIPVWEKVIKAFNLGYIDNNPDTNTYFDSFLSGQSAMAMITYDEYKILEQRDVKFNWSIVTMPQSPMQSENYDAMKISGFYAIPNSSKNKEAAWELLKFFNSDKAARWEYRSEFGFSTLLNQIATNEADKERVTAFYKLTPKLENENDELPGEIRAIADKIAINIFNQSLTLKDGLDTLQKESSQELIKINLGK